MLTERVLLTSSRSRTGVEVRLWRAIRNHRKTYPSYITEQQQQQHNAANNNNISTAAATTTPTTTTNDILDELNRNEINRNVHGLSLSPRRVLGVGAGGRGSVPEINVQPGSNCNSFDSAATNSSEDYESCNGGHMTGDERMDL